jgi:hypothetical protein
MVKEILCVLFRGFWLYHYFHTQAFSSIFCLGEAITDKEEFPIELRKELKTDLENKPFTK